MAAYIAILEQDDDGCGYTIGCGVRVMDICADSYDEAFEKMVDKMGWEEEWDDEEVGLDAMRRELEWLAGEGRLKRVRIIEVLGQYDSHYPRYLSELKKRVENEAKMADEKHEREEYERLKKKFRESS